MDLQPCLHIVTSACLRDAPSHTLLNDRRPHSPSSTLNPALAVPHSPSHTRRPTLAVPHSQPHTRRPTLAVPHLPSHTRRPALAAAIRHEKLLMEFIKIAANNLTQDQLKIVFRSKASGFFFGDLPMRNYGTRRPSHALHTHLLAPQPPGAHLL